MVGSQSVWSISSPCTNTSTGPSPPESAYSIVPADRSIVSMRTAPDASSVIPTE